MPNPAQAYIALKQAPPCRLVLHAKDVVSKAGEAYNAQDRGLNRKFGFNVLPAHRNESVSLLAKLLHISVHQYVFGLNAVNTHWRFKTSG
jgi:hypothetical protein